MPFVDDVLNRITMYRLVLYYLTGLLVVALLLTTVGILPYAPLALLFTTLVLLLICAATNYVFATVFEAIPNVESVYITAFILALLITPVAPTDVRGVAALVFAGVWAMASKYIFAIHKKHLFNPAAFGIACTALLLNQPASWWVAGNLPLLPLVLLGGLLITRKIRRFDLVASFTVVTLTVTALSALDFAWGALQATVLHSAGIFFALVMLTEPLTMPPSRLTRLGYGALVGLLFAPTFHLSSYSFTPEIALLIGNMYVFVVSPKVRAMLTLIEKNLIATDTYEYVFSPDTRFSFIPGQYLEWTLAHASDSRGNRRYFTIASSPTEPTLRLGVKFYEPKSSFKQALAALAPKERVSVSSLGGDFTLPTNRAEKLVWIAGGIGITPFRSQVQYLLDTQDARTITLFYSNKTAAEIAYRDVFDRATNAIGLNTVYALTSEASPLPGTYAGMIDAALITRHVPDYRERTFYISGPHGMVTAFQRTLTTLGVSPLRIKTDYFPGFA